MAIKIDIGDMKFDTVAYSKQNNIMQIIKYLKGTIAITINSNADDVDGLKDSLAETANLLQQVYDLVVSLMDMMGGMIGDMGDILDLIIALRQRMDQAEQNIEINQSQIHSIQQEVNGNETLLYNMAEMRKDFMDHFPLGAFLKSLGGTSTD